MQGNEGLFWSINATKYDLLSLVGLNYPLLGRILQISLIKGKLCKLSSTRENSAFLKLLHFAYNYKINFEIVTSITNFILSSYAHNKISINIFRFAWSLST